ncbi:unnamed protein product [Aureobasidium uvarum]|uniref:Uncharacterized protein n=1 Tax=Aureobasidium uvarum TaxID=2773716 RepID=A0A9N8PNX8_9PEZI|nr:unnamed protein product [Aureobasidium uvarum]
MTTTLSGHLFSSRSAEYHESAHARYWTGVPYERTRLNLLDICVPKRQPENPQQAIWLVLNAALDMILEADQPYNVAGFVSLDYRLSPYPSHPTSPSSPGDDSRNVQHPEHLNDILAALFFLGANTAYREFVTAAFGEDEKIWATASQLCCRLQKWQGNVLLIQSVSDELVDMQQTDLMVDKLVMQGFTKTTTTVAGNESKQVSKIVIDCLHDEVWEKGVELAKAIRAVTAQK